MYVCIQFYENSELERLLRERLGDKFDAYLNAALKGFGLGLLMLEAQLLNAIGMSLPRRDVNLVGIALTLGVSSSGWVDVFTDVHPTITDYPPPLFSIGHSPRKNVDIKKENRIRFFSHSIMRLLPTNDLPTLQEVEDRAYRDAELASMKTARNGFPKPHQQAMAIIGKAFGYLNSWPSPPLMPGLSSEEEHPIKVNWYWVDAERFMERFHEGKLPRIPDGLGPEAEHWDQPIDPDAETDEDS